MFLVSVCPDKDFSLDRSLDLIKTIKTILGFQGKTLAKEFIDIGKPVTASVLPIEELDTDRAVSLSANSQKFWNKIFSPILFLYAPAEGTIEILNLSLLYILSTAWHRYSVYV